MNLHKLIFDVTRVYKYNTTNKVTMKPVGILVHSTGANNPWLKRYVQPDDGLLGKNLYGNSYNNPTRESNPHGWIGKLNDGTIATYQTLPYTMPCWGCASGKNGSYNYNPQGHIQFEICEDGLKDENYFNAVFREAAEYCAYLCREFSLPVSSIVSHKEGAAKGYACNHGDPDHWLAKFGKDMNWFRAEVQKLLAPKQSTDESIDKISKERDDWRGKYEKLAADIKALVGKYEN